MLVSFYVNLIQGRVIWEKVIITEEMSPLDCHTDMLVGHFLDLCLTWQGVAHFVWCHHWGVIFGMYVNQDEQVMGRKPVSIGPQ